MKYSTVVLLLIGAISYSQAIHLQQKTMASLDADIYNYQQEDVPSNELIAAQLKVKEAHDKAEVAQKKINEIKARK